MSTNFHKKTTFFKDDQRRVRVIPGSEETKQPEFIAHGRMSAVELHEQRLAHRINSIPRQTVTQQKNGVVVTVPEREVQLRLIKAKTEDVIITPREGEAQEQLDRRSMHFVEMARRGEVIPLPLLHELPNGKLEVVDGRARANAYRMMGAKEFPANENGILSDIGKHITSGVNWAAKTAGQAVGTGVASVKSGYSVAKAEGEAAKAEAEAALEEKRAELAERKASAAERINNGLNNARKSIEEVANRRIESANARRDIALAKLHSAPRVKRRRRR
jgi:hypothetical protein